MPEFVKVAKTSDLAPGEAMAVDVGARRIALFNIEGTYLAVDDTCTHRGGPLSEGMVVGNEVTCPWHAAGEGWPRKCLKLTSPRSRARKNPSLVTVTSANRSKPRQACNKSMRGSRRKSPVVGFP